MRSLRDVAELGHDDDGERRQGHAPVGAGAVCLGLTFVLLGLLRDQQEVQRPGEEQRRHHGVDRPVRQELEQTARHHGHGGVDAPWPARRR